MTTKLFRGYADVAEFITLTVDNDEVAESYTMIKDTEVTAFHSLTFKYDKKNFEAYVGGFINTGFARA